MSTASERVSVPQNETTESTDIEYARARMLDILSSFRSGATAYELKEGAVPDKYLSVINNILDMLQNGQRPEEVVGKIFDSNNLKTKRTRNVLQKLMTHYEDGWIRSAFSLQESIKRRARVL